MNKLIIWVGLFIWAALPFYLLALPIDHFDYGKSHCPSVLLFHQECFACGLTRATQHMLHGDWQGARAFNAGIIVVFPTLIALYVAVMCKIVGAARRSIQR